MQTTTQHSEVVTLALVPEVETKQLQTQAAAMLAQVAAMPVSTPDEFKEAGAIAIIIAKKRTEIKEKLKVGIADIAYQAYKKSLDLWKQVDAPYEKAESTLSSKLSAYHVREEAKRRAAEEEARRKAEEEARQKQAALQKAAEEARQAQIAKIRAEQEAQAFRQAAKLEEEGRQSEADALVNAAFNVPDPVVAPVVVPIVPVEIVVPIPSNIPKVKGLGFRPEWKWELVNIDLVPREYLMLNEPAIGGVVRSLKDKTNIPGIRAYSDEIATKARK